MARDYCGRDFRLEDYLREDHMANEAPEREYRFADILDKDYRLWDHPGDELRSPNLRRWDYPDNVLRIWELRDPDGHWRTVADPDASEQQARIS